MFRRGGLRKRWVVENRIIFTLAHALQRRRLAIRPEEPPQELTYHGNGTVILQNEGRKRWSLVHAAAHPDAGQRHDGPG